MKFLPFGIFDISDFALNARVKQCVSKISVGDFVLASDQIETCLLMLESST